MSIPPPKKKPSGGRPLTRRLLSKESSSQSPQASVTHFGTIIEDPTTSSTNLYATLSDAEANVPKPWTDSQMVQSPQLNDSPEDEFFGRRLLSDSPRSGSLTPAYTSSSTSSVNAPTTQTDTKRKRPALVLRPKASLDPSIASTSSSISPPISPSRARWNQLREHVRSASIKEFDSSSPRLAAARATSPVPSFTSFSQMGVPTSASAPLRPSTPKPRLGLFRFGQVVNEARNAADKSARDFANDVQRACWAVRSKDMRGLKVEKETTQVRCRCLLAFLTLTIWMAVL